MRKFLAGYFAALFLLFGAVPAVWADALRLTVFGDSLVQGYGLPQGEGLVPQLEDWLQGQGIAATLSNAGVSGDTTAGGAARIDWTMAERPDGVIVLLGGNDLLRGLPPEETRANLTRIVEAAQGAGAEVMLIGMLAPLNYGPEFKAQFDSIYTDLAASHGLVLHPSAFAGILAATGADPAGFGAYMQADGIHPNAKGVAVNIAAMAEPLLRFTERLSAGQQSSDG